MKLNEAAKVIKDGWIRRRKGFRIRFEKRANSEWVVGLFPDQEEALIRSEIAAWEYARRFAEAARPEGSEMRDGDIANVYVVDDLGDPVKFYGTNELMVLNERKHEGVTEHDRTPE